MELIQIVLKYNNLKLILIFDQYKKDNLQSYPYFEEEIKLLMEKNKQLKIILYFTLSWNTHCRGILQKIPRLCSGILSNFIIIKILH